MASDIKTLVQDLRQAIGLKSKQYQGLILGCSGGLDSTVLFHLLCHLCKEQKNFPLRLLHVNYRLRGSESEADQEFVEQLAKQYGCACEVIVVGDAPPESGLQAWARGIRHKQLSSWSSRGYLPVLAHHADDVIETMLFRMARGVSLGRWRGMRQDDHIWRPLLGIHRATLAEYAADQQLSYRHDQSNDKLVYSRNLIRHRLLPQLDQLFASARQHVLALGEDATDLSDWARQQLTAQLTAYGYEIPISWWTSLPKGVAFLALDTMILHAITQGSVPQLSRRQFERVWERLQKSEKSCCFDLPGRLLLKINAGKLMVVRPGPSAKHKRAAQHRRNITTSRLHHLVEPGARIELWPTATADVNALPHNKQPGMSSHKNHLDCHHHVPEGQRLT